MVEQLVARDHHRLAIQAAGLVEIERYFEQLDEQPQRRGGGCILSMKGHKTRAEYRLEREERQE
ncbi:MAG: hypothetical protein H0V79_07650 [Actinobacteria bacterium]|nr:hypothetical protein [Actinomycetota bacterium]